MKNPKLYSLIFIILICLFSCKKSNNEITPDIVQEKAISYPDSISFVMNEKEYIFNEKYIAGMGNQPINIKPSAKVIKGGKLAYETGGYYWYGEQDSTLYSRFYNFSSKPNRNYFKISFTKKFKDSQLHTGAVLLHPENDLDIFKVGKASFAVDLEKENTMDGISIDFYEQDINKVLSTKIPGSSILVRSALKNDIQNNSSFEITKVEKLKNTLYLIRAKFEANLFYNDAKLYRIKNGFLQFTTNVTPGDYNY